MSEFRSSLKKLENLSSKLDSSLSSTGPVGIELKDALFENMAVYLRKRLDELTRKMHNFESMTSSSDSINKYQNNRIALSLQCKKIMMEIEETYFRASEKLEIGSNHEDQFRELSVRLSEVRKTFQSLFHKQVRSVGKCDKYEIPLLADAVTDSGAAPSHEHSEIAADFQLYYEQAKQANSMIDDSLDKISDGCTRLKENALYIHDELSSQHAILHELNKKEESIHGKMSFLNQRLQKILFDFDNEKIFLYLLLFIALITVVGYILYQIGAVRS